MVECCPNCGGSGEVWTKEDREQSARMEEQRARYHEAVERIVEQHKPALVEALLADPAVKTYLEGADKDEINRVLAANIASMFDDGRIPF
jgi:uncharacterized Zn finger protein (UPF0148 family)